jgi:hypothetical protein
MRATSAPRSRPFRFPEDPFPFSFMNATDSESL